MLELSERLEEQMMVVEEAQERVLIIEEQASIAEEEVDSLKTQLADYQQALDVQQTRAAISASGSSVKKAKSLLGMMNLPPTALKPLSLTSKIKNLRTPPPYLLSNTSSICHRLRLSNLN